MESFEHKIHEENTFDAASEELLWRYADDEAPPEERIKAELMIASVIQWKEKYNELLQLKQLLHSADAEGPSMRFTKNVMEVVANQRIAAPAASYVDKRLVFATGGLFAAVIIACFVIFLQHSGWQSPQQQVHSHVQDKLTGIVLNSSHICFWLAAVSVLGFYFISKYLRRKQRNYRTV